MVEGRSIIVGNQRLMEERGIAMGTGEQKIREIAEGGKTLIWIADRDTLVGVIALEDIIREESAKVITALRGMGIKTAMRPCPISATTSNERACFFSACPVKRAALSANHSACARTNDT